MEKTITVNKDCEEIGVDLVINDDFLCDIVENILNNGSLDDKFPNVLFYKVQRAGHNLRVSVVTDKFICDMIEEMDEILNGANT